MRPPLLSSHLSGISSSKLPTFTLLLLFGLLATGARAATQSLTCSPTALRFGSIMIGQSETLPVIVTNSGSANATVSSITSNLAAFTVSGLSLPVTIAPGKTISFSVAFTPTTTGWQGEAISLASTLSAKSFCTGPSGTGVTNEYLIPKPASIGFGNVPVGTTATLPLVLTNSGQYFIELSQELTTGSGFAVTGLSLPMFLAPKQSVTMNVQFTPQSVGSVAGDVDLTSTGVTIPLTGTGTSTSQLIITPATLSYGNVDVGTTATQTMTMSATGTSVTISSGSSSNSQFALEGASFPVTIPAGKSASFAVGFTPKSSGTLSGSLSFTTSLPNSPSTEAASGVGVLAQYTVGLSWNPSNSPNITGYNVYRAVYANACGTYSKVNSILNPGTTYTDSTAPGGATYCYATTAVNSSNEESTYSNQAEVAIP
ncbi:MAG: choice-of-anchor D domain-containing protein [Candidatus Sulfotelmatobacter sp.]